VSVHIGTSGWHYDDWRPAFYPDGLARKDWLTFYGERFSTVESNAAFYRLPETHTFEDWARQVPDDFRMSVKMSRYLTHVKRLADPAEPVHRFLERAEGLGDKLGPVLLQLPPNLKKDVARLDATLTPLCAHVDVAVEFRHESWFDDETRSCLEAHRAALCLTDRGSRPASPLWRTADWTYLRFHSGTGKPQPCYGRSALASWGERLRASWGSRSHIWVFFNNDTHACALRDARRFRRVCERVGFKATRVPKRGEVSLGPS
jgi:uncharacterized protein YecE (DUF72 family)